MSFRSGSPRVRFLGLLAAPVVLAAVLAACGEDSTTSAVVDTGASTAQPTTTSIPPTSTDDDGAASGSTSSEGATTTTTTATGSDGGQATGIEQRVRTVVDGAAWGSAVTDFSVFSGTETIVSVSTDDEAVPGLEACEALRSELTDQAPQLAVNVWLAPDLTTAGGDERQLATALPGGECELVRSAE